MLSSATGAVTSVSVAIASALRTRFNSQVAPLLRHEIRSECEGWERLEAQEPQRPKRPLEEY